jgi:enterobactin synthetase component D
MSSPEAPAGWGLLRPWWPAGAAWQWQDRGPDPEPGVDQATALLQTLPALEAAAVARAVPRRQLEFATGRWCARQALQALGVPPQPVPAGADRAPVWPHGVVGTISHDDRWCVAGVAHQQRWAGLGVDIERVDRFGPDVEAAVCTPFEVQQHLAARAGAERRAALARIFSLKEAAFKALYPSVRTWIDFQDAEAVQLPAGDCGPALLRLLRPVGARPAGQVLAGAVALAQGRVVSLLALPGA